jgi:HPt (histidine-containing phosphotransfer) domain-containing protein
MDEVLTKPFEKAELFEILQRLIGEKIGDATEVTYSLDYLMELSSGDAEFVGSILATFTESTPRYLSELNAAVDEADLNKIKYVAHQLKPSLQTLKVTRASELAIEIEKRAKEGCAVNELIPLVRRLESDLKTVIEDIKERNLG